MYSTGSSSVWAVFACILNLPPHLRYKPKNMLLVLCHPTTPQNFAVFVQPLNDDLLSLHQGVPVQNGIDPEHKILTGSVGFITCDMDAKVCMETMQFLVLFSFFYKVKVQNCVGYRGYWGCFYCKITGEYFPPTRHVYYTGPCGEDRNSANIHIHATQNIWGVKGLPCFYNLQMALGSTEFDCILSMALDVMHQACILVFLSPPNV